jgi:hypothetical protein
MISGTLLRTDLSVDPAECRIEILYHLAERSGQRRPPSDEHIIVAAIQPLGAGQSHDLPQPPTHPVPLDGIAHLPRHRETDAHHTLVPAPARLQYESAAGGPRPIRYSQKVAPALEPFDDDGTGVPIRH